MLIGTVYYKQRRYCRSKVETIFPRMSLREELVREIRKRNQKYKGTILMIDANEDLSKGKL